VCPFCLSKLKSAVSDAATQSTETSHLDVILVVNVLRLQPVFWLPHIISATNAARHDDCLRWVLCTVWGTLTYDGIPGYFQCVSMLSTILPPLLAVTVAVRWLNKPKLLVNEN